jgi:ABC-type uncharacterized transport system substrate-binding protein
VTGIWLGSLILSRATAAPSGGVVEITAMEGERPTVLVLRKSTPNMDTFLQGLEGELKADFNIVAMEVGRSSTVSDVASALTASKPDAIVLLDNPTAELYREYQELNQDALEPPAVIAMALFVEQTAARLRNATGIAYEVPAVTSFVRLRTTIRTPVRRIGVVHRPAFARFVQDQARLAAIEGFEIVPFEAKQRPGIGQVRKGLRTIDKLGVDALWVLNDNVLLTPELLVGAWLPAMRRNARPVVVGVSNLLRTDPPVGSFAVLPDHQSLGMQTADLIYELHDAGWSVGGAPPQLPIAVETVLNRTIMERTVGLQQGAIDQVDEVVE